jgi:hypothetical protein
MSVLLEKFDDAGDRPSHCLAWQTAPPITYLATEEQRMSVGQGAKPPTSISSLPVPTLISLPPSSAVGRNGRP